MDGFHITYRNWFLRKGKDFVQPGQGACGSAAFVLWREARAASSIAIRKRSGRTVPVVIGDAVFIGANAITIKEGHIGDFLMIGTGAVVTIKQIPSVSLVVGTPVRIVRRLPAVAETGSRW